MSNVSRHNSYQKEKAFHLMKLEVVVIQLISEPNKLPIRTLKTLFRNAPVISVFTGSELVTNIATKLHTDKREALHIATQLFKYAYLYPVDQSVTSLKDDSTLYRMQTEDKWPSQCTTPTNMEYSTYLAKKMLLKQKLTEHEQEAYERFSVTYARNWPGFNQKAHKEIVLEEELSKEERVVFQGEERAFWRLHRPPPGEPLVMESSIQKRNLNRSELTYFEIIQDLEIRLDVYKKGLKRNRVKCSHSADLIISHMENNSCHDPLLKKNFSNPWTSESKVPVSNVDKFQLWSLSFDFLIRDKTGRDLFMAFLKTEVSTENLKFCEEVSNYKMLPASQLVDVAQQIFKQYIGPTARNEINIDGKTLRIIRERISHPDRYTFDPAQNYIYDLMRKDSYFRFLKSPFYTDANKKCSMERKAGRKSHVTAPPNALHLSNGGYSADPPATDSINLVRSNSMDTLSEVRSMMSPTRTNVTESQNIIGEKDSRRGSLFRNSSGLKFSGPDYPEFGEKVEQEKPSRNFNKSKSLSQPYTINQPQSKKTSASFDEMSLSEPSAPALKNFPKPKSSKSYSQEDRPIFLPL